MAGPRLMMSIGAMIRAELRDSSTALTAATPRALDRETRAHLADARIRLPRRLIRSSQLQRQQLRQVRFALMMSLELARRHGGL
jgi:hypothetical protein